MYFRILQRIWRQIGAKVLTVRKENTKYGKVEDKSVCLYNTFI